MRKVLVIGAGAAGLAAARRLATHEVAVTILEARNRIGGRIHTLKSPAVAAASRNWGRVLTWGGRGNESRCSGVTAAN